MASSTGLLNFAREFPDRFFDVGLCEQHAVAFAAGLPMSGLPALGPRDPSFPPPALRPPALAVGRMVEVASAAADRLEAEGISCGVINARWVKPMDGRLLSDWAVRYPVLVTAEDNVAGGFGSAVLEALAPAGLAGKVRPVALPDAFLPHGKPST